jgi:ubiquinone/menaquinone biosynthesis C-methylase UbiE
MLVNHFHSPHCTELALRLEKGLNLLLSFEQRKKNQNFLCHCLSDWFVGSEVLEVAFGSGMFISFPQIVAYGYVTEA